MDELRNMIERMVPDKALAALAEVFKDLLGHLDEKKRIAFFVSLLGGAGRDKVASMVDL